MKPGTLAVLAIGLAAASLCVRLGFWQVSRWHEKQARNVALSSALAAEPLDAACNQPLRGFCGVLSEEACGHQPDEVALDLRGRRHRDRYGR